jgi:hypothetical protein
VQTIGRRARKAEESIESLRAFCEQLSDLTILYGQHVQETIALGQDNVLIRHSLGRPYAGGFIVGQDDAAPLVVLVPEVAEQGGVDVSKFVAVVCTGPVLADTLVRVWVY